MEVKVLNSSTFASLSATYELDNNVSFKNTNRNSYHGFDLTLDNCLSGTKDTTINNYSSFFLSDDFNYNDFLSVDILDVPENYTFTSYIISESTSMYLSAIPAGKNPLTQVTFADYSDNKSFFEIFFIDNLNCKIKHTEGNLVRYLSYNYVNSEIIMLTGYDTIGNNDINTFQYVYDRNNNVISFSKKIYDKTQYLYVSQETNSLLFKLPPSNNRVQPFKNFELFKLRVNTSTLNDIISTSNYTYKQSLDNTKIIVDEEKSTYDFDTNYLFNNEYYSIDPYLNRNLNLNVLNLKNQKTVNNTQSQGGVFLNQPSFKHRYYENLFTGVKQEKGNSNIGLGYSSYTITKTLKSDALSYFHMPYDMYPYEKLNINDSSLVISGAISSDTPYYSDKIFKKLNDYKYSSPYGNVTDTQTNAYLCSWLSGGNDINDEGVWLDRYYNPSKLSYIDALVSVTPYNGFLQTNFDSLSQITNNDNNTYDLYDVTSNLTFEKGALYAYHHVGNENSKTFVNALSTNLVIDKIDYYFSLTYDRKIAKDEIIFESNSFTKILSEPLDSISPFDNFSVSFDISNENWNKPFGSQILGNYADKGFGIFNYRKITPYSLAFNKNKIYVINTQCELIRTITTENNILNLQKFEPNSIFLVYDNEGYVTKYNYIGTTLDKRFLPFVKDSTTNNFYSYGKFTFILTDDNWYRVDNNTLNYQTNNELNYNIIDISGGNPLSLAVKGSNVYLLSGYNPKIYNDEVYFYNSNSLNYYNILESNIGTKLQGEILDYVFDNEGNIYCLYDIDKLAVVDKFDNEIGFGNSNFYKLSAITGFNNAIGKGLDIIDEFYGNEKIDNYLSIVSLSANLTKGHLIYSRLKTDISESKNLLVNDKYFDIDSFSNNFNINNYDYLRNNFDNGENIVSKIKLPNIYDTQTYETATLTYPLSNLSPGYHNFTITFDSINGLFQFYIDGKSVDKYAFDSGKYSFGTIFDNSIYIGTEPSYGNNKLNEILNDVNYYNYGNFKLKNFYFYNTPLYLYDIANIIRSNYKIQDLYFEIPTGKRNYIENIDKFFKNKLPGRKSNLLNISIQDTGITDKPLQTDISEEIISNIYNVLPANTKLNKIVWEKDD